MKKLLITTIVVFSLAGLAGCAYLQKWTDAQAWCAQDTKCLADTKGYAEIGKTVAGSVYPVAAPIAGGVVTFIMLGILGWKRKPKEQK